VRRSAVRFARHNKVNPIAKDFFPPRHPLVISTKGRNPDHAKQDFSPKNGSK
jgi:hypothetical protein